MGASSLQQSISAPDPSTTTVHLTKINKSFDPKAFSAFWDQTPHYRDETDNAHGGSDNHNYGLDGDVLSEEQYLDPNTRNDSQYNFQKDTSNIAMWIAIIFLGICGIIVMCTCLCLAK